MLTLLGCSHSQVTVTDSCFKKSHGGAIHLEGAEMAMKGTQISMNKGDNAVSLLGGSTVRMDAC